jgi:hypothetical protein
VSDGYPRLRDIAASLQSACVAAATIAAALFANHALDTLRSRGEYEKLVRELRDHRVVSFEFQSSVLPKAPEGRRLLVLSVTIANKGRTTEIITWPPAPVSLSLIKEASSGPNFQELPTFRLISPLTSEIGVRLMPGITLHRLFVATVKKSGLYYATINLPASAAEQGQAVEEGVGIVSWSDDTYIFVP